MRQRGSALLILLLAPLTPLPCDAGEGRARLVSFEALQNDLGDPGLRILDARPKADYDQGHLPGAVWVDPKAVEALAARPGGLADREAWEAQISPLGLGPKTRVVVYDARRQVEAARLWWLLTYLGVDQVALLDGSFPLWSAQRRPTTTDPVEVAPEPFRVAFRRERLADRDDVQAALASGSAAILDARSGDEFRGVKALSKRSGHLPGACHLEWSRFVDDDGRFLDGDALQAKIAEAGVDAETPIITHCHGGGRAAVNAFVLERLGLRARNYYLGWSDWGNAEETPVQDETRSDHGDRP